MKHTKGLICLYGPTASGKSSLAVSLSKEFGGTIINSDSQQIYRGLPLLTAQPSLKDMSIASHKLYGVYSPLEMCTVAQWREKALAEISESSFPFLVGGTGLYFKALLEGLSPIPSTPLDLRLSLDEEWNAQSEGEFYEQLCLLDPWIKGRLRPTDRQRLIRAKAVFLTTGKSIVLWQQEPKEGFKAPVLYLYCHQETPVLNQRIEKRAHFMIENGALEEVELLPLNTSLEKACGVREIRAYLKGETSREQMVERLIISTRQYAKRQRTWFRTQMPFSYCINPDKIDEVIQCIHAFQSSVMEDKDAPKP